MAMNGVPIAQKLPISSKPSVRPSSIRPGDYRPIVRALISYFDDNNLWPAFQGAVQAAVAVGIPELEEFGIKDVRSFLDYVHDLLFWTPTESVSGKDVYYRLVCFYFVFNLVEGQQSPIVPVTNDEGDQEPMKWLSKWLVWYAQELGTWMDNPHSLTDQTLATFDNAANYNLDQYTQPRGGWSTFNQFFSRHVKPGFRPVDHLTNPEVVTSPVDGVFSGAWTIDELDGTVTFAEAKHIKWSISELLDGSPYKDAFKGGVFTHSFLNTFDYHRQHAPVSGQVVETRNIEGQAYLETKIKTDENGRKRLHWARPISKQGRMARASHIDAPDTPGYQFVQLRGLVVLLTPIGYVAVLPIGMAQVSSVMITAETMRTVQLPYDSTKEQKQRQEINTLQKGEEISYFQFGGSDIVTVFQKGAEMNFNATEGFHYSVGNEIARAKKYAPPQSPPYTD
ncbi:MAG: hypothetical protein Q9162_005936 [Coniocarpon cinnabarinum]